jgi:hypothetical protein
MAGEYVNWGGVRHHLPHPPTLQDVIDYIGTQQQFRPSWHPAEGNEENFESWQRRIIMAVNGAATSLGLTLPPHPPLSAATWMGRAGWRRRRFLSAQPTVRLSSTAS